METLSLTNLSMSITPQKIISSYRNMAIYCIIMSAMSFFTIRAYRYSPIEYSIVALILGAILGFILMLKFSKNKLRMIEKEGYYKPKQKTNGLPSISQFIAILLLFILGISIIIALFVYMIEEAPFWFFTVYSMFGFASVGSVTITVSFWRWQRKNKRILLTFNNILYPYPYMNQPTSKETVY